MKKFLTFSLITLSISLQIVAQNDFPPTGPVVIGQQNPGVSALKVNGIIEGKNGIKIMTLDCCNGVWVDMPAGGTSGIGTIISGNYNAWIGYASGDGHWFYNSKAGDVIYRNLSGKLLFGNSEASATMAVANNKVGIGTLEPQEMLTVNGTILSTKVKVLQSVWPDYVFKPSYHLRSLKEVERYIFRYQHLPGVPSASEVSKEGLDLGSNQSTLLKKIEELTLYLIEQDKRLEKLQGEIDKLKRQ